MYVWPNRDGPIWAHRAPQKLSAPSVGKQFRVEAGSGVRADMLPRLGSYVRTYIPGSDMHLRPGLGMLPRLGSDTQPRHGPYMLPKRPESYMRLQDQGGPNQNKEDRGPKDQGEPKEDQGRRTQRGAKTRADRKKTVRPSNRAWSRPRTPRMYVRTYVYSLSEGVAM